MTAVLAALVGVVALHLAQAMEPPGSGALRTHVVPLGVGSCVFGAVYLAILLLSNVQLPGALGALLGRRRSRQSMAA